MPAAIDLNDLLAFATVAEAGSFTGAADRMGTSKAAVSLKVRRLEAALGYDLFHRTTRRITLTDPGSALLANGVPHLRSALEAVHQLPGRTSGLSGTLRISCTVDHATQGLPRHLVEFGALHPELEIDLRTSDRVVDLVRDGIDLALRMGWLPDSSLRATKLDRFSQVLVASPAYLKAAGTPTHPDELAAHAWIALTLLPSPMTWKFSGARGKTATVRMRPRIRTDSAGSVRSLVEAGAGISVVDEPGARIAVSEGRLVRLLPQWSLPEGGLYAVFPPGRHPARAAHAFVEFYRKRLEAAGRRPRTA